MAVFTGKVADLSKVYLHYGYAAADKRQKAGFSKFFFERHYACCSTQALQLYFTVAELTRLSF